MKSQPGIALQLYTLRDEMEKDFLGVLREVARMGYPAVQPQSYGGMTARELRRVLDDLGLAVAGTHLRLADLDDRLDAEIAYNLDLGNKDLICASIPIERRQSAADWEELAALFARAGARCKAAGARFSHHNHHFEFENVDGRTGIEILFGATDPTEVFFEPDVYWIAVAGLDPAAVIERYAARCRLIHLKDRAVDGTFAEVGEGTLDFQPIFAASEAAGAEWYVVEQDRCQRPALESVALSLGHLRDWGKLPGGARG